MLTRHNRRALSTAGTLLSLAFSSDAASAQGGGGARIPPVVKRSAEGIMNLFKAPLHPIIKGVASGGGLGAGLEYDIVERDPWQAEAKGVYTINKYWSVQADAGYVTERALFKLYGRQRDMGQLSFYGPGPESLAGDRTNFHLRDLVVGARGAIDVTPWLVVGGRVENLRPEVSAGRSTTIPELNTRFTETDAPGLSEQPRFMRYEGSAEIRMPAGAGGAFFQGARYRATYAMFDDGNVDNFDFQRLDIEAQHRFAIIAPHQSLTLHGWLSTTMTPTGSDVPFYLQRTLGGKSNLRTVDEDLIGSDGTQASLRGFPGYRFRDRHLLLLQAEYRIPLWGPIDATLFTDAGKVTRRFEDIDLSNLKSDYGFSLSLMQGLSSVLRLDVGFGGGEGVRLLFNLGHDILP